MIDSKEIYKMAKAIGLSADCKSKMVADHSLANLGIMYFDGSDWSMEHDFPKLELLQELKGKTEEFGLYADCESEFKSSGRVVKKAFFGNSKITFNASGFSVNEIYIRHDSECKIIASQNAYLTVNVLDNAKVEIDSSDYSKVNIYAYGNTDNIKIKSGEKNVSITKSKIN